ncbi:MAG: hypothetical protein C4K49_08635 [Candidatus Thorarchaeota archaeon]|nr:MAG: hypothetical protein C4K49_08635 [Candidatus Thorarchaeota archaeon]
MVKLEKSDKVCSVTGCSNPSKRSFATIRIAESVAVSGLKLKDAASRKTYLCSDHWKSVKKAFKKDTKPERLRWGHP